MARNLQRLSNLVGTFGPGAMLDLPTRSVLVGGLERWEMRQNAFKPIEEPRLARMIERTLKATDRLDPACSLSLRTPPLAPDLYNTEPPGVAVTVFPTWFVCEAEAAEAGGREIRRRRPGEVVGARSSGRSPALCAGKRQKGRCDAHSVRCRLRKGPFAGHRLAPGRAWRREQPRADVARRDGDERRPARHTGGVRL